MTLNSGGGLTVTAGVVAPTFRSQYAEQATSYYYGGISFSEVQNAGQFALFDYYMNMNMFTAQGGEIRVYAGSGGGIEVFKANDDGISFFGVDTVVRAGTTQDIKDALTGYGLLQGTSATPLNLDGGKLTAGKVAVSPNTLSISAGTVSVNAQNNQVYSITLTQNITLNKPTNGSDMDTIRIRIIQDGTGGRTITLATGWDFGSDITDLSLDTTANSVSYITAIYYSTGNVWQIISVIGGY